MPESYTNSKILNRQSPSKSTLHTMAKIFRVLWTMTPGTFSSIACLPVCQQQKSMPSPQCGTVPPGPQSSTWWWADYTGLLIIIERAAFCSYWNIHPCEYRLEILAYNAPSQTTIQKLTECLTHCHNILHSITSDQGLSSRQMECIIGPKLLESVGLTMFPIVLKQLTWGNG